MSQADREKWDTRYKTEGAESRVPSGFLTSLDDLLPRRGRALDVAGGAGRNAVWLAHRGLDVTLVDISAEGLVIASQAASDARVSLSLMASDLEENDLPDGPFDLILSCYFLRRALFSAFTPALARGGLLVYQQPTRSNLERHPRPPAGFLLDDGELPSLVQGLEIVRYDEGWFGEGADSRHEARLVARKR